MNLSYCSDFRLDSFRPILYQLIGLILCRSTIEKNFCVCFGGEGDEFLTALRVSAEVFSALLMLPLCKFPFDAFVFYVCACFKTSRIHFDGYSFIDISVLFPA